MPSHAHVSRSGGLRREIAALAARMMAEDGISDFGFAKRKAARQLGGTLHCVVTTDRIRRIFSATGLERVLVLHETLDEALDALAVPQS